MLRYSPLDLRIRAHGRFHRRARRRIQFLVGERHERLI
jgi:hypothetical protein